VPALEPDVLAALLAPLPGARAGRDLRYDPRYDAIREARREDPDLPQGAYVVERKVADWPKVQREAVALLSKETKDLQLAAWLTEALLRRTALPGLTDGLAVITGLLTDFWEDCFPELEDGDAELRLGPVEWVANKLDLGVRQSPVTGDGLTLLAWHEAQLIPTEQEAKADAEKKKLRDARVAAGKRPRDGAEQAVEQTPKRFYKLLVQDADAALAALEALAAASDERFGDEGPGFGPLRAALTEVQRFAAGTLAQKLLLDPDPVEPEPAVEEEAVAVAPGASGVDASAGGGTLAAEPGSPADASARVVAAARYLRRQDPTSPTPYLLLRALRWGELRSASGRLDARMLEAAAPNARTRLRGLLLDGNWTELLEQSEQVMATPAGRGWLDLQRYAVTACHRLGPGYAPVAAAVRHELAALLADVPQLPEMTLMDDTPAANAETQDWLAAEGLTGDEPHDGAAAADVALPDGSATLSEALAGEHAGDQLAEAARGMAVRGNGRGRAGPGRRREDWRGTDASDPFVLARAELARGRANRAVELLVAELDRERSARGRFVRETQIAQLMVEAGLAEVARPILRRLVDTIKERSLDTWESGALVAQPLVLMCRVIDALDLKNEDRDDLYLRICRLDPLQAMALKRGS
jgi:type VI secretion system protein ImpA